MKAEKATSKNQHVTYFLYSYCVFLRNCTWLGELIKVCLDFSLQILKIIQNYLEAAFRDLFLNKNPIQHFVSFVLLEHNSIICWSDTGSLFYHHLPYKLVQYIAIFIHTTPFCTGKNSHVQAPGQSLISGPHWNTAFQHSPAAILLFLEEGSL